MKRLFLLAPALLLAASCMRIEDGLGGRITFVSTQREFGAVVVGQSKILAFSLQNTGGFDASRIRAASLSGAFSLSSSTCSSTLPIDAACEARVAFTPPTAGEHRLAFSITYFDGELDRTAEFALVGTGVTAALLAIPEAPLFDFGSVGFESFSRRTFVVTNVGQVDATSLVIQGPGASGFSLTQNGCGSTLAALDTCSFEAEFRPSGFAPVEETVVAIYQSGDGAATLTLTLKGSVGEAP